VRARAASAASAECHARRKTASQLVGPVVYQKGAEHVDQIYDADAAAALRVMRELCGTHWRPERVLFAHTKPTGRASAARHFEQNLRPSRLSLRHFAQRILYPGFYVLNSSSNAFAAFRSAVSKPSVNQP
jgi:hypothetical protein